MRGQVSSLYAQGAFFSMHKRIFSGNIPCSLCNYCIKTYSLRGIHTVSLYRAPYLKKYSNRPIPEKVLFQYYRGFPVSRISSFNPFYRSKSALSNHAEPKSAPANTSDPTNIRDYIEDASGTGQQEGPVLHHSARAAVVVTHKSTSSSSSSTPDLASQSIQLHPNDSRFPLVLPNLKGVSTEELLFCTTAYVKKITHNNDWRDLPGGSSLHDVEYILEEQSTTQKHAVRLSGALPASAREWRAMRCSLNELPAQYAALAKSRLTGLVVATALGGYVMAPVAMSASTLIGAVVGTALISSSANTTNQILEAPYDAQMNRTANRVLVRGILSPLHAATFAGVCGAGGVTLLYSLCDPVTASLGAANLLLYTAVYTPMKRVSIANTWIGAVVGAIPPLMGWSGCGGSLIGWESWGAWTMAGLLFAWQFPHFNALSWNLRADYSKAGYRMMCVTNPRLCRATCVRYSAALLLLSVAAPALSVTTWTFAVDSAPLNAYMLYLSYRFYRDSDSRSARNLFRFSLLHLPAVMVLMIISKKWRSEEAASEKSAASQYSSSVVYIKNVVNPDLSSGAAIAGVSAASDSDKVADDARPSSTSDVSKSSVNTTSVLASLSPVVSPSDRTPLSAAKIPVVAATRFDEVTNDNTNTLNVASSASISR